MYNKKPYKKYYIYWAGTNYPACNCCYDNKNYVLYFLTDIQEDIVKNNLVNYIDELKEDKECDFTEFLIHFNSVADGVLFQEYGKKEYSDRVLSGNVVVINLGDYSEEEIYSGEKLSAIKRRKEKEEKEKREEKAKKKKEAQKEKEQADLKKLIVKHPDFAKEIFNTKYEEE
jgi:hypothetical protein